MESVSYQQLVGDNLRRLRDLNGWSQEDVADIARGHGLPWRQSTVQAIEKGRREMSWLEALLLQYIFPPLELLRPDGRYIECPGVGALEPGEYQRWISARYQDIQPAAVPRQLLAKQRQDSIALASRRKLDGKVAKALGAHPVDVSGAALDLWGHGFAEERDRRLAEAGQVEGKSERMRLAWITRRMIKELEGKL